MDKKAGIITFIHNENYGSILQAWALQQAVNSLGWQAETIDYRPGTAEKIRNMVKMRNSPELLMDGFQKRLVRKKQPGARRKSEAFEAFRKGQMKLSAACGNEAELGTAAAHYQIVIAGSDQIWSPVWLNPVYFLDFVKNAPKAAYAASFGVSQINSVRKKQLMTAWLHDFGRISVREQAGAALMKQMNGCEVPVVPDPVFLVEKEKWLRLAEMPRRTKPYLLCYFIGNRKDYWQRVHALQQQTGLPVVVMPVAQQAYESGFELAEGLSPTEWLGWIAGASMLITDSFHGAAFACILGVQPEILRRYRDEDPESKNSRIDQLREHLKLDEGFQPEEINSRIGQLRRQGMDYLRSVLCSAEEERS